ncbi:Ig-like domain-containing protein, partial [Ursidibacter sp. B-7004-1]
MNIILKIHSKSGAVDSIKIPVKGNEVVTIQQPKEKVSYELVNQDTNAGPERIFAERKGNDLHIAFEENQPADLIIKDYYSSEDLSPVIGLGEDGQLYSYIAESGIEANNIPLLKENVLAAEVLGGKALVAAYLPFNWLALLGGLATAGLVAATLGGKGGKGGSSPAHPSTTEETTEPGTGVTPSGSSGSGSNGSYTPPRPQQEKPTVTAKKDGSVEIAIDPNVKKYEITFIPEGKNNPITATLEKQADGSYKSSHPEYIPDVPAGSNKAVIPSDSLKDKSLVSVTAISDNGSATATVETTYDRDTQNPEVTKAETVDRNNDGKPDLVNLTGKGEKGATIKIKDKEGNVIAETKVDNNGNWSVPVVLDQNNPNKDQAEDLNVEAQSPGKNSSDEVPVTTDKVVPSDNPQPNDTYVEPPVLTPSASQPEDEKISVDVKVPDDATNVPVQILDGTGKVVETIDVKKDEQGNFVPPSDKPEVEVTPKDGGFTITIPKDKIPENGKIVATAENSAGDQSKPSEPIVLNEDKQPVLQDPDTVTASDKPSITPNTIKAIDESPEADNNPEKVVFSGTAEPNASITAYLDKGDGSKIPVGSVVADNNGNYEFNLTDLGKNFDIQPGDQITVTATTPGEKESEHSEPVTVPAVEAGKDGHPYDTKAPEATVEITTKKEPGDGSAEIAVTNAKPGDKVTITANNGKDKLTFIVDDNGNLTKDPANTNPLMDKAELDGNTIKLPEDVLEDGSNITAVVTDLAGNSIPQESDTVGYDEASEKPTEITAAPIDTNVVADKTPENIKVTLKGDDVKPGSTVALTDEKGNEIAKIVLTPEHIKEDGKAELEVPLNKDNPIPKEVKATVQAPGKDPSAPATAELPSLADTDGLTKEQLQERHPNDKGIQTPTVVATPNEVKVTIDPKDTETFTVTIDPKAEGEATKEVVYTKQPDGSYTPNDPTFPTLAKGEETLSIPRDKLPKGASDVTVKAEDIVGHTAESAKTPVDPILEPSKQPEELTVKAADTDKQADRNPEEFTITGKAEPNAEIVAKDHEGNVIGRVKADEEGNFKLIAKENGADITDSSQITLIATAPNKRESVKTPVPSNNGEVSHPNDLTPPPAAELVPDNDNAKFTIEPEVEKATVEYTDNDGTKKTAEVTRDKDGNLQSNDPNVKVEGKDTIIVPNENTQDDTPVSVVTEDLAGNTSEPTVAGTPEELPNNPEDKLNPPKDLKLEATDTRQGGADDRTEPNPDHFVLKGNVPDAPAGTEIEVTVDGVVVGKGKTDDKGNFEVEFNDKVNGNGEPIDITKDSTLVVKAKDPKNPNNNSDEAPIAVADTEIIKADNTAPTVELAPTPNGAEVTLDPNANVGDTTKVTVEKDGKKVEHEYKVNDEGKWEPTEPEKSPAVNPDGTVTIVAPPGSTISAETADTAGNTNKPEAKPNAEAGDLPTNTVKVPGESDPTQPVDVPKTAQPTAEITKVIDQDSPADGKVDAYEVTGKVPGEPVGTPVRVYDEEGNLLGEGKTTDDEGNFTINPVEKPKSGETLVVKAENPEKQPS